MCWSEKLAIIVLVAMVLFTASLPRTYMSTLWIMQKTPLWMACWRGHRTAAEVLIAKGAYVRAHVKDNGKSQIRRLNCLGAAVKEGHKYVVQCSSVYCSPCVACSSVIQ